MPDAELADLEDELEAERADHADTMKRAQEAWRVAEKLAAALRMARPFLGMAIKSPNCAAYVADEALGDLRRHSESDR